MLCDCLVNIFVEYIYFCITGGGSCPIAGSVHISLGDEPAIEKTISKLDILIRQRIAKDLTRQTVRSG